MKSKVLPQALQRKVRRDVAARGDRAVSAATKLARLTLVRAAGGMPTTFGTRVVLERFYGR